MADTFDLSNPAKPTITKDPDATLDYSWDWAAWLTAAGNDSIASFLIVLDPPLALVSSAQVGGVVTAFISGGEAGNKYTATCRVVTAGGRTDDRSIFLNVKDR